jgi:hypothetical protein
LHTVSLRLRKLHTFGYVAAPSGVVETPKKGGIMRLKLAVGIYTLLCCVALAKEPKRFQKGELLQMDAVDCGYDENSGKSFVGEMIGTDGAHKKTKALLCHEYLLKADSVLYRIRPMDEKHPVLLPIGEIAQFRIDKDKMKLRVEDGDDKERNYAVVSMTPRADSK